MTDRPADVVLDDLAAPVFAPHIQEILDSVGPMAADLRLVPEELKALAVEAEGIDDFGDDHYEEALAVLCRALTEDVELSAMGVVSQHTLLVQLLRNRLRVQRELTRHPEIRDIEIEAPIIVAGLPRTGTTHLHNLMSADPALRSLPYWESLEPVPPDDERGVEPDPRRERCDLALGFMDEAMPYFKRMHEMTTDHVHEEIQLLALDFDTMLFESVVPLPTYRDWWKAHRPDGELPVPEGRAAGAHPRAGRRPLGPQVPPAPELLPGPGRGVPGRHLRGHPPGPGGGDPVDGHDGRLLVPDEPGPPRPRGHGGLLAGPGPGPAGRLRPGPRRAARRPDHRRPLRRVHGRRPGHGRAHLRPGRPALGRPGPGRARGLPGRPPARPPRRRAATTSRSSASTAPSSSSPSPSTRTASCPDETLSGHARLALRDAAERRRSSSHRSPDRWSRRSGAVSAGSPP